MSHTCHWPGCSIEVPPKLWGCKKHWFMLPKYLRDKVWLAYKPGQEITKTPSKEYIEVALEVQEWVRENKLNIEAREPIIVERLSKRV